MAHKSYLRIRICISANATVAATATGFNLTSIDRQTHIDLMSTWADIFHNRAKEDWDRFESFPPVQSLKYSVWQLWTNLDFTEIQTDGWLLLDQTHNLADYNFFALRSLFMAQRASRWPKLWLCSFQFPVCPVFVHCPVSLLCPLSCALLVLMSSMQLCATHTQASHPGPPHTHSLQQLSSNLSRTLFTCRPNWAQTYFNRS